MDEEYYVQRTVRRNFWFSGIPRILLGILIVALVWELIRQNLNKSLLALYPWRLHTLDASSLASLLGVFIALTLAREQFARSIRPAIGWSGRPNIKSSLISQAAAWFVCVYNGGPGYCLVVSAEYRYSLFPGTDAGTAPERQNRWMAWRDLIKELEHVGLHLDRDYYLVTYAAGGTIPNGQFPGAEPIAVFDSKSLAILQSVDVRLTVADVAGDEHRRILRLLHIAPSPYPRIDVSEGEPIFTTHGRKVKPIGRRPISRQKD